MNSDEIFSLFGLDGRVAVITGAGGLLGAQHAAAVLICGGNPVLIDVDPIGLARTQEHLKAEFGKTVYTIECDITRIDDVKRALDLTLQCAGDVNILINNAARNPKIENKGAINFSRLENFSVNQWDLDLAVGLGGAFHCAQIFGGYMAQNGRGGVIINVASDLGVIAPDQRLYRVDGLSFDQQPVKPVTYSVVKHGLIGLTKYLATYWCEQGVRCNSLSPGGVEAGQDAAFISKLSELIPLGRMAQKQEYRGAIAFLCSDASSYMNGANLIMDGGRSAW